MIGDSANFRSGFHSALLLVTTALTVPVLTTTATQAGPRGLGISLGSGGISLGGGGGGAAGGGGSGGGLSLGGSGLGGALGGALGGVGASVGNTTVGATNHVTGAAAGFAPSFSGTGFFSGGANFGNAQTGVQRTTTGAANRIAVDATQPAASQSRSQRTLARVKSHTNKFAKGAGHEVAQGIDKISKQPALAGATKAQTLTLGGANGVKAKINPGPGSRGYGWQRCCARCERRYPDG